MKRSNVAEACPIRARARSELSPFNRATATGLSALALSGCALLAEPKTVPITQDYVGWAVAGRQRTSVFSTTAERRTVLVHSRPSNDVFLVCAEPPADVAESFTKSLVAAVEVSAQESMAAPSISGKGNVNYTFGTAIAPLLYRSQGVQLFRDGLYNLCQANMNQLLRVGEFSRLFELLLGKSYDLIHEEIPSAKEARAQMALAEIQKSLAEARTAANASNASALAAEKARADAQAVADKGKATNPVAAEKK